MIKKRFWSAIAFALVAGTAVARPPSNPDPRLSAWFESLIDQDTMLPCCGEADCRLVESRVAADHQEAFVQGAWLAIPEEKILRRLDNPTGRAVLCWSPDFGVMCFVPGPGV